MHPILFEYGPIQIRFYGLMYVVAILVANYLIKKEVERKGISLSADDIMNFIIWTVAGGVIGARLYYVGFNWDFYGSTPSEIPAVWHGGLAIHGGMLGGVAAAYIYLKRQGVEFWTMADAVAPSLILGQAFGRFGNFMNGDAHGRPTDAPWGIVFPPGSIAGSENPGVPLHPAMLYEMSINIGIFLFLWLFLRKRAHSDGFIFAAYIALYSLGRFFVEHFRADSLMLGPIKAAQLVSLVVAVVAIAFIISRRLWQPRKG